MTGAEIAIAVFLIGQCVVGFIVYCRSCDHSHDGEGVEQ